MKEWDAVRIIATVALLVVVSIPLLLPLI